MKSKSLLIFLLGFSKMLVGQDSLKIETVQDSAFVAPQYSSVYDDVFMNKKETKWLFKVDALGLINLISGNRNDLNNFFYPKYPKIEIGFEHKIGYKLSVNFSLSANLTDRFYHDDIIFGRIYVEPRWYLKKLSIDDKGAKINNLNGSYIGLKAFSTLNHFFNENENQRRTEFGFIASYGIQKRVFNKLYIDYQLGVGIVKNELENYAIPRLNDVSYFLNNKFTIGIALGGKGKSEASTCDLFQCFESENSIWKFDIRDILKSYSKNDVSIFINPEYERKLGQSSFSLNTGVTLNYTKYSNYKGKGIGFILEPRYYYNLKKRIRKGKSANNLSGNYFSLLVNAKYNISITEGKSIIAGDTITRFESFRNAYEIEPRWGMQRRLFKNGFLDISLALFKYHQSINNVDAFTSEGLLKKYDFQKDGSGFYYYKFQNGLPSPNVYFKIGFAF
jgi:Protein of unknown function (DUF3575)